MHVPIVSQACRRLASPCWPTGRAGIAGVAYGVVEVHKVLASRAGRGTEDAEGVSTLVALQRVEVVDALAHIDEAPDNLRLGVGNRGRAVVDINHGVGWR